MASCDFFSFGARHKRHCYANHDHNTMNPLKRNQQIMDTDTFRSAKRQKLNDGSHGKSNYVRDDSWNVKYNLKRNNEVNMDIDDDDDQYKNKVPEKHSSAISKKQHRGYCPQKEKQNVKDIATSSCGMPHPSTRRAWKFGARPQILD